MTIKSIMTSSILEQAGAEPIAELNKGELSNSSHNMLSPGFYFLVLPETGLCHARYFCGRQRSGKGFYEVVKSINYGLSEVSRKLSNKKFIVMFIDAEKMKPLTTGWKKGQISMIFTRSHSDNFQNLSEINRILNDNFKFVAQKY